jgi:hypothetical protein
VTSSFRPSIDDFLPTLSTHSSRHDTSSFRLVLGYTGIADPPKPRRHWLLTIGALIPATIDATVRLTMPATA